MASLLSVTGLGRVVPSPVSVRRLRDRDVLYRSRTLNEFTALDTVTQAPQGASASPPPRLLRRDGVGTEAATRPYPSRACSSSAPADNRRAWPPARCQRPPILTLVTSAPVTNGSAKQTCIPPHRAVQDHATAASLALAGPV